jgi:UDP-GlcNAc:undecaprenyl-phosphate GlcNAc-1-phosphate transferase
MRLYILVAAIAFAIAFAATPIASALAVKVDAVDQPGGRRIHLFPTPRFGGLAIFIGLLASLLAAAFLHKSDAIRLSERGGRSWCVVGGAAVVMLIGLIDDRRSLQPAIKLCGEVAVAALLAAAGYRIQIHMVQGLPWVGVLITVVWITSVMNAVNMIDGLDGLAAGVCLIISVGLLCQSLYYGNQALALMLAALSGAILGFLPFNFRRARIFLGDSGSLLLGFLLAVAAIQSPRTDSAVAASVAPVLALGLPLAELLLTSCRRVLRELRVVNSGNSGRRYSLQFLGRPRLFTADRDHIHHRLLDLGISPVAAVLVLYLVSATLGAAALMATRGASDLRYSLMLLAGVLIGIRYLGYAELQPLRSGLLLPAMDRLAGSPVRVFIAFDLVFGGASMALAVMLHEGVASAGVAGPVLVDVPVAGTAIVIAQVAGLALGGIYRHTYREFHVGELVTLLKSISLAAIAGLLIRWAIWPGVYGSILLIDGYLIATLVMVSRLAFVVLDYLFNQKDHVRRILIYGADDTSARALKQLCADSSVVAVGAGFIDGDPGRRGLWLNGLRIYGTNDIESLIRSRVVDELFVPARENEEAPLAAVVERCAALGLPVIRANRRTSGGEPAETPKTTRNGYEGADGRRLARGV